jgi:hypothetical protein
MKKIVLLGFLLFLGGLVNAQSTTELKGQSFGETVTADNVSLASQVDKKLGKATTSEMKLQGEVVEVCKKKGCFVKLKTANNQTLFVKFKDYAFFVPKDIEGKQMVIDGVAERKVTTVAQLRHFAEDAKKSPEEIAKIVKPKKEIVFVAKGVVVLD